MYDFNLWFQIDVITCVALDNCGSYLVTGSKDCTCIVWSLIPSSLNIPSTNLSTTTSLGQINTTNSLTPRPMHTLYGHDDTVSCVAIMTELDLVVSGSLVSNWQFYCEPYISEETLFAKNVSNTSIIEDMTVLTLKLTNSKGGFFSQVHRFILVQEKSHSIS